jgi:hypothetical protein
MCAWLDTNDVVHAIAWKLSASDVAQFSGVCHATRHAMGDDGFWCEWAKRVYGPKFWFAARQRPPEKSLPQSTWRGEVVRLERFQALVLSVEGRRWNPEEIQNFWIAMDDA